MFNAKVQAVVCCQSVTTDDWVRYQASPFQIYGKRSDNGTCLLPNSLVFPLSLSFHQCSILILINTSGRRKETFKQHCYFWPVYNSKRKHFYFIFLPSRDLKIIDSGHTSWSSAVRFFLEISRRSDILHWKFLRRFFFRVFLYRMRTGFSFKRRRF